MMLLVALSLAPAAPGRTWTDVQGRKIEAEWVSSTTTDVTVKLTNGKTATIPLSKLSPEDQAFAQESAKASKPAPPGENPTLLNFDQPWPQEVRFTEDPQIQVVSEDKDNRKFVYESANYRFTCDVRLSQQVVKGFAVMFEATRDYCQALPLAISGGERTNGKFEILLFEAKEDYIKAGGPPQSSGVFIPAKNIVMVPLESLGVKKVGSGYMLDREASNGTLIHELTHQLTPAPYFAPGSNGWFSEGLAEYTTATPYRNGKFQVKSNFDDIVDYTTDYRKTDHHGRALGKKIKAPRLKNFVHQSYQQFTSGNANFNYGFGLILTTYFLHLDGAGDAARTKTFLKALRDGQEGEEAFKVLLDGRSYEQLETDISKAWKRKGVDIEFTGGGSSE